MKKTHLQRSDNIINSQEGRSLRPRMAKPKRRARPQSDAVRVMKMVKAISRSAGIGNKAYGSGKSWRTGKGVIVRPAPRLAQRVIVKSRYLKMDSDKSRGASRAHLHYITRDSVGIDGEDAVAFNNETVLDENDIKEFVERGTSCPHQFRFIVSPENGAKLDMEVFAKKFINALEKDLGTRLDYVAVVHYDTDNPHIHFVVNGKSDKGKDLRIHPEYLKNGIRARGSEIATRSLGLRPELELQSALQKEILAPRFTSLDIKLLAVAEQEKESQEAKKLLATTNGRKIVDLGMIPKNPCEMFMNNRGNLLGRLLELEKLELAYEARAGVWVIDNNLKEKLQKRGKQADILQAVGSHIKDLEMNRELVIVDNNTAVEKAITGRVAGKGLINELYDGRYMVIDGLDGKIYYASLSLYSEKAGQEAKTGNFVTLDNRPRQTTPADEKRKLFIRVELESTLTLAQQARAEGKTMLDKFGKELNLGFPDYGTALQKEFAEAVIKREMVLEITLKKQRKLERSRDFGIT